MSETLNIVIIALCLVLGGLVGGYLGFKFLTLELNESLKKIGFKILAIFAIFNIFNDSSSEMQDSNSDKKTD